MVINVLQDRAKPGTVQHWGQKVMMSALISFQAKNQGDSIAVPCSTGRASCAHTLARFITCKGDVELAVFRQTESFPYCLGELLVAC